MKTTFQGITEKQVIIYKKLLSQGSQSAGAIAKATGFDRVSCYDILNRLVSKGLAYKIQEPKIMSFHAVEPSKIVSLAETKAEQEIKQAKNLAKKLENIHKITENRSNAMIFNTKNGVKSVFESMLAEKKIFVISGTGNALNNMKKFFPKWHKKRKKMNIQVDALFNSNIKETPITRMPLAKISFLPEEYSSPTTVFIFGKTVATLLWQDNPFMFVIKSEQIAISYKNYFNIIKKITKEQ